MPQDTPKRSLSLRETRRWIIVGMYIGVMFLGLPYFPLVWEALAKNLPAVFHTATTLILPLGVLALVIGIRKATGPQSRMFSCGIIALIIGFGLLVHYVTLGPAEQFHAAEYALLAVLVYRAPAKDVGRLARCLIALTATFIIGLADEAIQYVLPNRVFDPRDIWLNWTAGAFGVCLSIIVHGQRHPEHRQNQALRTMQGHQN